eukprot:1062005-Prymnesium_polylepis.1
MWYSSHQVITRCVGCGGGPFFVAFGSVAAGEPLPQLRVFGSLAIVYSICAVALRALWLVALLKHVGWPRCHSGVGDTGGLALFYDSPGLGGNRGLALPHSELLS